MSYFKNAITVECTDDLDEYYLDFTQDIEFFKTSIRILNQKDEPYSGRNTFCQLWSESKGYAKILTYKTKQMKISKDNIIKLDKKETTVRELFPEVFKIDFNEPILSLNDLLSVWGPEDAEYYKTALLFKDFERLAERKLNNK